MMMKAAKEVIKNGNRIYLFDKTNKFPSLQNLKANFSENVTFVRDITLNPKSENSVLYSQFSQSTVPYFLYAFAYQIGFLNPCIVYCNQFEMNARRLRRLCTKRYIKFSEVEERIINICETFHMQKLTSTERKALSENLISELNNLY